MYVPLSFSLCLQHIDYGPERRAVRLQHQRLVILQGTGVA